MISESPLSKPRGEEDAENIGLLSSNILEQEYTNYKKTKKEDMMNNVYILSNDEFNSRWGTRRHTCYIAPKNEKSFSLHT